jgi:hypothetical protein
LTDNLLIWLAVGPGSLTSLPPADAVGVATPVSSFRVEIFFLLPLLIAIEFL